VRTVHGKSTRKRLTVGLRVRVPVCRDSKHMSYWLVKIAFATRSSLGEALRIGLNPAPTGSHHHQLRDHRSLGVEERVHIRIQQHEVAYTTPGITTKSLSVPATISYPFPPYTRSTKRSHSRDLPAIETGDFNILPHSNYLFFLVAASIRKAKRSII
jgi:hypothetical protein